MTLLNWFKQLPEVIHRALSVIIHYHYIVTRCIIQPSHHRTGSIHILSEIDYLYPFIIEGKINQSLIDFIR